MKVTIGKTTYNLEEIADAKECYALLVPANWLGDSKGCVKLFLATKDMIVGQLIRHLGSNWKKICKEIREEQENNNPAKLGVSFSFEIDQTDRGTAAVGKVKMSFSVRHTTTSSPEERVLAQSELFPDAPIALDLDTRGARQPAEKPAAKLTSVAPKKRGKKGVEKGK